MKQFLITIGKIKAQYRWGVVSAIMLIIVVAYYFVVFLPHQTKMKRMFDEYNSKKAEFTRLVVLVRDRGQFMEEVESLNRELKVAISMLPDKKEIPSLLKKVSEEAEKFGLNVYFFEPKSERKRAFYAEVPVAIKLKGSFQEVLSFFDSVNKMARIVNISNIRMISKRKKVGKKKKTKSSILTFQQEKTGLDVSFNATTYRFLSSSELKRKGGKHGKK